jgi:hypothetical protein
VGEPRRGKFNRKQNEARDKATGNNDKDKLLPFDALALRAHDSTIARISAARFKEEYLKERNRTEALENTNEV